MSFLETFVVKEGSCHKTYSLTHTVMITRQSMSPACAMMSLVYLLLPAHVPATMYKSHGDNSNKLSVVRLTFLNKHAVIQCALVILAGIFLNDIQIRLCFVF